MQKTVSITNDGTTINFSNNDKFKLIAGPCVLENIEQSLQISKFCKDLCLKYNVEYIFKGSFDKANRTSIDSFRGLGLDQGLAILNKIKDRIGVPVLTDIHVPSEAEVVADVVDIIQIPAFLCRQTDLVTAAAKTGKVINIKKAQFLSADEMLNVLKKVERYNNSNILLTERGTFFGYNNLVVDFKAVARLKEFGYPVVFDATHSTQLPGGFWGSSDGERKYMPALASAAAGVGVAAFFMEVHPQPDFAMSDKTTVYALDQLEIVLKRLVEIDNVVKSL
ncbi:MAG: 3-deoxy-8-phosphooctulonate synthase [bacterium]|nr:3-deoxy-8-phosphooctulonate synthase [bacterium]